MLPFPGVTPCLLHSSGTACPGLDTEGEDPGRCVGGCGLGLSQLAFQGDGVFLGAPGRAQLPSWGARRGGHWPEHSHPHDGTGICWGTGLSSSAPPGGLWSWLRYQGWWQITAGVVCCCLGVRLVFWGCWLLMAALFTPHRRCSCTRAEECGAELGHAQQQPPLHLHQPPAALLGAAGALSCAACPDPPRLRPLGTSMVPAHLRQVPTAGRGEDLSVLWGWRAQSHQSSWSLEASLVLPGWSWQPEAEQEPEAGGAEVP